MWLYMQVLKRPIYKEPSGPAPFLNLRNAHPVTSSATIASARDENHEFEFSGPVRCWRLIRPRELGRWRRVEVRLRLLALECRGAVKFSESEIRQALAST